MSSSLLSPLAEATIPEPPLKVLRRLKDAGFAAFLVGGCVRDLLRGAAPKDYDIATSALPEEVQRVFPKTIPTGIEHGTITVRMDGENIEVTTFRTEGDYQDGRRPSRIEFHTDIVDDLSRRDFTFNAIAYDPLEHSLVDPFGGQEDLIARRVRCVRDAHERFNEDGLRTVRAVRFAAVLDCTLDPDTEAAIPGALGVFRKVAVERIQIELEKLLLSKRPGLGVTLLEKTGLWKEILPELAPLRDEIPAALERAPPRLEVRLALPFTLSGPVRPGEALRRLKFPNKVVDRVELLVGNADLGALGEAPDATLRRFLAKVGLGPLEDLAEHALASASGEARSAIEEAVPRLRAIAGSRPALSAKELALDGGRIMAALGVGPSPMVGQATRFLLDLVLENPGLNTPETLIELLARWAEKSSS